MAEDKEIRTINGVKYEVIQVKCDCICHKYPQGQVKHVRACCQDGYKRRLVKIRDNE